MSNAYRDGFLGFCRDLDILSKTGSVIRLDPNPSQVARDAARTPRDVVLKARQTGSTTFELARDVWFASTNAGSRVVVLVPDADGGPDSSLRVFSRMLDMMIQSGEHSGVVPTARQLGDTRWQIVESILEVVEAREPRHHANRGQARQATVHRLHTVETGYIESTEAVLYLMDSVPPADTGSEIVHESTVGNAFFSRLCRGAIKGDSEYALHFTGWMQRECYALPVDAAEVIEPSTDRERAIVALGGTPAQVKWYRRKVSCNGQRQVDLEYPIDANAALAAARHERHQAA